jgi:hypothetical protein
MVRAARYESHTELQWDDTDAPTLQELLDEVAKQYPGVPLTEIIVNPNGQQHGTASLRVWPGRVHKTRRTR